MSIPKPIEIPEHWESKLKPSSLFHADETQKDLLNGMNVIEQQITLMLSLVKQQSERDSERAQEIEDQNERLKNLERMADALKSKWSLAVGAAMCVGSFMSFAGGIGKVFKKLFE